MTPAQSSTTAPIPRLTFVTGFLGGILLGAITGSLVVLLPIFPQAWQALLRTAPRLRELYLLGWAIAGVLGYGGVTLSQRWHRAVWSPAFWRYSISPAAAPERTYLLAGTGLITLGGLLGLGFYLLPLAGLIGALVGLAIASTLPPSFNRWQLGRRLAATLSIPIVCLGVFLLSAQATLLHGAARWGHPGVTRWLLDQGASIHATDRAGKTPLHYAAEKNQTGAIAVLLQRGANIHTRDAAQRTALHDAARAGSRRAVGVLLAAGADPTAHDNAFFTAVEEAAIHGHTATVYALLAVSPQRKTDSVTALWGAAANGWADTTQLALDMGADPSHRNRDGATVLDVTRSRSVRRVLQQAQPRSGE